MDEQVLRARADELCAAIVAGDMGPVIATLSEELRRNLGEVIALLPLPAVEATVESVDRGGGAATNIVLRIVGETEEVSIQTRWKDRDGSPTIIEASNLTSAARAAASGEEPPAGDDEADFAGEAESSSA